MASRGRPRKENPMVAVDLRLPPLLLKRLRILAKSEGREWPELVRTALLIICAGRRALRRSRNQTNEPREGPRPPERERGTQSMTAKRQRQDDLSTQDL